jgi:hypothetical protein
VSRNEKDVKHFQSASGFFKSAVAHEKLDLLSSAEHLQTFNLVRSATCELLAIPSNRF